MESNNTQQDIQVEQQVEQDIEQEQPTEKTFTQSEVDALLQKETDRRVNSALDKAKAKWESEYQSKLEAEKSEAERLAKMSESERQAEEMKKLKDSFDAERESFNNERKAFEMERLKLEVTKQLNSKGIPIEFADFLLGDNADVTKSNMDLFSEKWTDMLQAQIEEHVSKALSGNPPRQANTSGTMMSRKEFSKLPYKQRQQMMEENPELVKQILAQR